MSRSDLPPDPGQLESLNPDAARNAQAAADDAQKMSALAQDELKKALGGSDQKIQDEAYFAAKKAETGAFIATGSAGEVSFREKQKSEHNAYVATQDANRNGKSDYQEIKDAEEARRNRELMTMVAVAGTIALGTHIIEKEVDRGALKAEEGKPGAKAEVAGEKPGPVSKDFNKPADKNLTSSYAPYEMKSDIVVDARVSPMQKVVADSQIRGDA